MRCKNCGSQNEDGRYICQNCGSPLYDENDGLEENGGYYDNDADEDDGFDDEYDKKNTKKSIIIIVILAVLLVAIISGIIFAVANTGKPDPDETLSSDISISENIDNTSERTTESTTEKTTESTTESTTEKTTESTTTTTSKPAAETKFRVIVDIDGNGTITGDGEYSSGKRATLVATAENGAQFIGWYENGSLVASGNKFSFTVTSNRTLTAVFQKTTELPTDNTTNGAEENAQQ